MQARLASSPPAEISDPLPLAAKHGWRRVTPPPLPPGSNKRFLRGKIKFLTRKEIFGPFLVHKPLDLRPPSPRLLQQAWPTANRWCSTVVQYYIGAGGRGFCRRYGPCFTCPALAHSFVWTACLKGLNCSSDSNSGMSLHKTGSAQATRDGALWTLQPPEGGWFAGTYLATVVVSAAGVPSGTASVELEVHVPLPVLWEVIWVVAALPLESVWVVGAQAGAWAVALVLCCGDAGQ